MNCEHCSFYYFSVLRPSFTCHARAAAAMQIVEPQPLNMHGTLLDTAVLQQCHQHLRSFVRIGQQCSSSLVAVGISEVSNHFSHAKRSNFRASQCGSVQTPLRIHQLPTASASEDTYSILCSPTSGYSNSFTAAVFSRILTCAR